MITNTKNLIINDSNSHLLFNPVIDGERKGHGYLPRDYNIAPRGFYKSIPTFESLNIPLIPSSEWQARIEEQEKTGNHMENILRRGNTGKPIPSLDQDGFGYCWAHSSTMSVIAMRAAKGLPYVPLSAFMVAATIKNGKDEGGWGAQSLQFIADNGVCSQDFWPQKDASLSHNTPEMRANAALHKITKQMVDLQTPLYDRNYSWEQLVTLLLLGYTGPGDFNWWGHSVCLVRAVWVDGEVAIRFRNSWSDSFGDMGFATLQGSKARPDGCAMAIGVSTSIQ